MTREIGGFLGLDVVTGRELHDKAIRLDSGRNCFKYILKAKNISKVYLPLYISGSMVEPFKEISTKYEYYNVNEQLEIDRHFDVGENEKIVVVNYFTMKTEYVNRMVEKYRKRIIVDNTHAFFQTPPRGIDTIYSPSKFIGVSDGGYLYTDEFLDGQFDKDVSWKRAVHIFGRVDTGPEAFYNKYRESEDDLRFKPIRIMSNLTQHLLASVDYETIKLKRERNFYYLHSRLGALNELGLDFSNVSGPFVYPLLSNKAGLHEFLISEKIFVATYWERVLEIAAATATECSLAENLVPLPIDQRYNLEDMDYIVKAVLEFFRR